MHTKIIRNKINECCFYYKCVFFTSLFIRFEYTYYDIKKASFRKCRKTISILNRFDRWIFELVRVRDILENDSIALLYVLRCIVAFYVCFVVYVDKRWDAATSCVRRTIALETSKKHLRCSIPRSLIRILDASRTRVTRVARLQYFTILLLSGRCKQRSMILVERLKINLPRCRISVKLRHCCRGSLLGAFTRRSVNFIIIELVARSPPSVSGLIE